MKPKAFIVLSSCVVATIILITVIDKHTSTMRKTNVMELLDDLVGSDQQGIFAKALADLSKRDTATLEKIVSDKEADKYLRMRAAEVLGIIGQNDEPQNLFKLFSTERDEDIRYWIGWAMCWRNFTKEDERTVLEFFNVEKSESIRSLLAIKLAKLGAKIPEEYFQALADSPLSNPALDGQLGLSYRRSGALNYETIVAEIKKRPGTDSLIHISESPVLTFDEKVGILERFAIAAEGTQEATNALWLRGLLVENKRIIVRVP